MAVSINFNSVVINTLHTNTGVFMGENLQWGWSAHSKRINGNGAIFGQYNVICNPYALVNNNSVLDTPINDNDLNLNNEIGPA
ncbi:MAG: hypothetical protein H7X86_06420 [Gorillibacterium sp.]|nr:hypothetical protein [Gorillibacterium sp.]